MAARRVKMAWQSAWEKKDFGKRAFRKESSKATRSNVSRKIVAEEIAAALQQDGEYGNAAG